MAATIEKIAKILHQAENATTEDEASLYLTRAQELATLNAIDLEVARQHQADKQRRAVPCVERVIVAKFGPSGRKIENNASEYCSLMSIIAGNNDVRLNIAYSNEWVQLFGFESDIEVTKLLFNSLVFQMRESAMRDIRQGMAAGVNVKVFKTSYYRGFISTVGQRLARARQEVIASSYEAKVAAVVEVVSADVTAADGALVLANKALEVSDFYKSNSDAKGTWKSTKRKVDPWSMQAGAEAGRKARLGTEKQIG